MIKLQLKASICVFFEFGILFRVIINNHPVAKIYQTLHCICYRPIYTTNKNYFRTGQLAKYTFIFQFYILLV